MKNKKLKTFCIVAKHESYRKVEPILNESFNSIRSRIVALEKELGGKLFETQGRKLLLTSFGRSFLPHAKKIIDTIESEILTFQEDIQGGKGVLTIGTTQAIGGVWMTDFLNIFLEEHPEISVVIKAADFPFNLLTREVDVSIDAVDVENKDMVKIEISDYTMSLYASQSYIDKHGFPKTKEELADHSIIAFSEGLSKPYELINWHLSLLPQDYEPRVSINSGLAIRTFVELGKGIGSVSQIGAKYAKEKLVKILPQIAKGPSLKIFLRYPKSREASKKIKALQDSLVKNRIN